MSIVNMSSEIQKHQSLQLGGEVFLLPGMKPSEEMITTMVEKIYQHKEEYLQTGDHEFPAIIIGLGKEDIENIVHLLCTMSVTSTSVQSFLSEENGNVANTLLHFVANAEPALSPMKEVFSTSLTEVKEQILQLNGQAQETSLFMLISTLPQYKQLENPQKEERLPTIENSPPTIETPEPPLQMDATTTKIDNQALEILQPVEKLDETKVLEQDAKTYWAEIRALLKRKGKDIDPKNKLTDEVLEELITQAHIHSVKPINGTNTDYEIIFRASENLRNCIENSFNTGEIGRLLFTSLLKPLRDTYKNKKIKFLYVGEYNNTSKNNQKKLPLEGKYPTKKLEQPQHNFGAIYRKYGVQVIEGDTYKQYKNQYDNKYGKKHIKNLGKDLIRPRGGYPVLAVSEDHNYPLVYGILEDIKKRYKENENIDKTIRSIDAKNLISLFTFSVMQYSEAQKNGLPIPESAFFFLLKHPDYLVITGAEKFLHNEGQGTFSWLFNDETQIILVSHSSDTDTLPTERKDAKGKRKSINMRNLALHEVNIPTSLDKVELYSALIMKKLQSTLLPFQKIEKNTLPLYTAKALHALAQGDFNFMEQLVHFYCTLKEQEKNIPEDSENYERMYVEKVYDYCVRKNLLVKPYKISLEKLYDVCVEPVMNFLHNGQNQMQYLQDDVEVKTAIATYMTHLLTGRYKEIPPLQRYKLKELQSFFSDYQKTTYTQEELGSYKKMVYETMTPAEKILLGELLQQVNKHIIDSFFS